MSGKLGCAALGFTRIKGSKLTSVFYNFVSDNMLHNLMTQYIIFMVNETLGY